jgi:hypothetical protein
VGHNLFKVTFPTKMELERMQVFQTFLVPGTQIQLKVDHFLPSFKTTSSLTEVWIYVTCIPPRQKGDFFSFVEYRLLIWENTKN